MKTFQKLQEDIRLAEDSAKSVVFMFGRFNPPTAGHEKMVQRAIQVAESAGIQEVRLYPSFSQDPKKNPLPLKEKIQWLRKFFKGVKVVEDRDLRTPFVVARKLSEEGMKRVIMVAGDDRVSMFQTKISKFIKHLDPDKSFEFDEFKVVSAGERDPDADDAAGVSSSKMREFVAEQDFENFTRGLPSRASGRDAVALFESIRRGMNLSEGVFQLSSEERDATFAKRLKSLKSPDIAEDGKCYAVVWADGRGIVAYRNRLDALKFIEQGDREVVSVRYRDAARLHGRSLMVRNQFKPDRSSIDEEWPDELESHDDVLFHVNEDFERLDEQRTVNWWYNVSRNKFFVVQRTELHEDALRNRFRDFGLKESDVKRLGLIPFMLSKGWARVVVESGGGAWDIETKDLNFAWKTAAAMDKKFGQPSKIFVGQRDLALQGNQVRAFIRTGKIVQLSKLAAFRDHVELDEKIRSLDKWWYNSRNGKTVEVSADFHVQQVLREPKKFGLSDKELDALAPSRERNKDRILPLQSRLAKQGWVEVTWSRGVNEAMFRAVDNKIVQKALNWYLNKINPSPDHVRIVGPEILGRRDAVTTLQGSQIDQFAKTGKIVRLSKLAAFR